MNIPKEDLVASYERHNDDVYPIFKKNGNFICFIRRDSFVLFYSLTGKLPGEYIEYESSCPDETIAEEIECELSEYVNKHIRGIDQEKLLNKMLKVREQLDSSEQIDYVDSIRKKYPKKFFKNRWPG